MLQPIDLATVHWIDEGIDTGGVLAYSPIDAEPGEGFPTLYVRATEGAFELLVAVLLFRVAIQRLFKRRRPS